MKIQVSGRVQRVGYRYFAQHWAEDFGLGGWAKNQRDGSVHIELEGSREKIGDLILELKKGPKTAHVEHIKVDWVRFENKFRNFKVKI